MAKPIGPICNLDCRYCYYLKKEALYPRGENFRMSPEVLETYIRDYLALQEGHELSMTWQATIFERHPLISECGIEKDGKRRDDRGNEFEHGARQSLQLRGPLTSKTSPASLRGFGQREDLGD